MTKYLNFALRSNSSRFYKHLKKNQDDSGCINYRLFKKLFPMTKCRKKTLFRQFQIKLKRKNKFKF